MTARADLARVASVGLRTRPAAQRAVRARHRDRHGRDLAVLGLSASSAAALNAEIASLGTNMLTVANGQTLFGATAELPVAAPGMIARIGPVTQVAATGAVTAQVYRSTLVPAAYTNGLSSRRPTRTC